MKRINKKTLQLVAATSMTMFSLIAVFSATIAWFSTNKEVNGSNADIDVVSGNGRLNKVYFHSFTDFALNEGSKTDGTYKFNKDPFMTYTYNWATSKMDETVDPSATAWTINQYETLTAKDKSNSMLMIFEFDKEYTSKTAGDIFIQGNTEVADYLGARDATTKKPIYNLPADSTFEEDKTSLLIKRVTIPGETEEDTKTTDYYAFSSVAGFKTQTLSSSAYTALASGETLDFATTSLSEGGAFTTIDNAANSYSFNQNPYIFKSSGSGTYQYIAVIVYYSPDAIGYIYSTYLGDKGLNKYDSVLHFACDWSLEVF